jgi:UDP-N-acetylmuramate dehydrogenase
VWANAGAHDADVRGCLIEASIIATDGTERVLAPDALALGYRDSRLKHAPASGMQEIVTSATFGLTSADPALIGERLDEIRRWRQSHQPIGMRSAGSVFRNPDGDSAGRLIDELALKGMRVGGAQVSEKHANFIVNLGDATAADVRALGDLVRDRVHAERGVELVYEVAFVGDGSEGSTGR